MRFQFHLFLLLLCTTFLPAVAEIKITKNHHTIVFPADGGYSEKVVKEGFATKEDELYIFYDQLQEINDLTIECKSLTGEWITVKSKSLKQEDVFTHDFYTGIKKYSTSVEKGTKFRIKYTITSKVIQLLSAIPISEGDSLSYEFNIPNKYRYEWAAGKNDSLQVFRMDTINGNQQTIYKLLVLNAGNVNNCYTKIYINIHPKEITAEDDLNNWFCGLQGETEGIDEAAFNEMKPAQPIIMDTLSYVFTLFNNIRAKLSYIDIEAGYGAWQPRNANLIVKNKKGDCKDMANVVYQCLKKSGVETYLAIIPSLSSKDDFTFPSMGICNHMICIARVNQHWQILDATDDDSPVYYPSRHTQGRTAFCFNHKQPFKVQIPVMPPDSNRVVHQFDLTQKENNLSGKWRITYRGLAASEINQLLFGYDPASVKATIDGYLQRLLPKYKIENITWSPIHSDSAYIEATITYVGQIFLTLSEKQYFNFSALPDPIILKATENNCYWINYHTQNESVITSIIFANNIELTKNVNVNFNEQNMTFAMQSEKTSASGILFRYNYINPYIEFNQVSHSAMLKLHELVEKNFKSIHEISSIK